MTHDIIIIGGGASGLFCAINAPKDSTKLIIEKQDKLGTKILLSGGGRCNFSNSNISPDRYFGLNKKMLPSVFHKFDNHNMRERLEDNNIQTQVEDNGRNILKSGKAEELLELLIRKATENNTEIILDQTIINIEKDGEAFVVSIQNSENPENNSDIKQYKCKKLIIATGGVSFPQVGTNGYGLAIAKQFDLEVIKSYAALCGIETQTDLSELSGSSILSKLTITDQLRNKNIYEQSGNILFTHIGLSGPTIFNATAAIGEYLAQIQAKKEKQSKQLIDKNQYIKDNITIKLKISEENTTKRLRESTLFSKTNNNYQLDLDIKKITNINNAKVSGGGISLAEIKPNFESKKIPKLYFIGETLDITGETGGFNLQWAWSSGFICGSNL